MRLIAVAAMTADGKIAAPHHDKNRSGERAGGDEPVTTWTSREDTRMFVRVTRQAGVVIMGRATYDLLPAPLGGRLVVVLTRHVEAYESRAGEVEFSSAAPAEIVAALAARGFATAVLAGGAAVYRTFLAAGLVDELWLTVEPLLFGAGMPLLDGALPRTRLRLLEVARLAEHTVQLKYAVTRRDAPA